MRALRLETLGQLGWLCDVLAAPATHLPWLMLMLLILSAQMAILVKVSITWSLCRITSPCRQCRRTTTTTTLAMKSVSRGFQRAVCTERSRTFCLLSSLGTCRTNKPSLSELTETPAGRGKVSVVWTGVNPVLPPPGGYGL